MDSLTNNFFNLNISEREEVQIPVRFGLHISSLISTSRNASANEALSAINELIQKLFSQMQLGEFCAASKEVELLLANLKIIKVRLKTTPVLKNEESLARLKALITSVKSFRRQKPLGLETKIPQSILSLIDINKALIEGLWQEHHLMLSENQELIFSEPLIKRLDDHVFEQIIKFSKTDWRYFFIDFQKYPLLSAKAPALLLQYSHKPILPKSYTCINTLKTRFCDYTLVVGNKRISVNKEFLAASSPFFKKIFESQEKEGTSDHKTTLHDMDPQVVRRCLREAVGCSTILGELGSIDEALSLLHCAEKFMLTDVCKTCALELENLLSETKEQLLANPNCLQVLDGYLGQLLPYFTSSKEDPKFPFLQRLFYIIASEAEENTHLPGPETSPQITYPNIAFLKSCWSKGPDNSYIWNPQAIPTKAKNNVLEIPIPKGPTELSTCLLPLINIDKSFIMNLWEEIHIVIGLDKEICLSEELKERLDDETLELILKYSSLPDTISIDFQRYPRLGAKAAASFLQYVKNPPKKCFVQCINVPSRFCDYTLVVGEKRILVNKGFLSVISPFFKILFTSEMNKGLSQNEAELKDKDAQIVQNCLEALTGRFDITSIVDINELLSHLHLAEELMLEGVAVDLSNRLVVSLNSLDEPLQAIDTLLDHLYPHFLKQNTYQFLSHSIYLAIAKALAIKTCYDKSQILCEMYIRYPQWYKQYPNIHLFIDETVIPPIRL